MGSDRPTGRGMVDAAHLVSGFRGYQMVVAACELRLPDLVGAGPQLPDDLAAATQTHAPSLQRLLRGLAAWRFFIEHPDGRFGATPLSDEFRTDRPGLRNTALMYSDDVYHAWAELLHSVRTGEPAYVHRYGVTHFERMSGDPAAAARFNAAMFETTTRIAGGFLRAFDFSGVRTVVDVGGGVGALLAAVLSANPDVRGVLFDLPQGLAGAQEKLQAEGLGGRVTLVQGDFFEAVPAGGDLYLLKSIVHDWDDERALAILKTCRRAAAPNARLVLLERVLPERIDDSAEAFQSAMTDLQMMVILGGRERRSREFADLLHRAGFKMTRVVPTTDMWNLVEAITV